MGIKEEILKLARENNGLITSKMISNAGFSKGNLFYLLKKGELERTTRGVYILPEMMEDEFTNLQLRFKKGIFSYETALFLLDLTDRTPNHFYMTFPSTYNLKNPKVERIRCSQVISKYYELGIETVITPSGNKVYVYNMERTLCDILKPRAKTDIQIISAAFKQYVKRKDKNIPKLSKYAKILGVEDKVRSYLEVLL